MPGLHRQPEPDHAVDARAAKATLRSQLLGPRAQRTKAQRHDVDVALGRVVARWLTHTGVSGSLACYLSMPGEPGTSAIVDAAGQCGLLVIVPVLRPDGDLDWAAYRPGGQSHTGLRGTREPAGPRLGVDAIARAGAVLVPALAVDRHGRRLGRGGGCYDRALTRVPAGVQVLAVVHDDEVFDELPTQPHDRRVDGALTPSALLRFVG